MRKGGGGGSDFAKQLLLSHYMLSFREWQAKPEHCDESDLSLTYSSARKIAASVKS